MRALQVVLLAVCLAAYAVFLGVAFVGLLVAVGLVALVRRLRHAGHGVPPRVPPRADSEAVAGDPPVATPPPVSLDSPVLPGVSLASPALPAIPLQRLGRAELVEAGAERAEEP